MKYQSVLNSMAGVQAREKSRSMFDNFRTEGRQAKLKVEKINFDKFAPTMNLE